jgi:outer membrane murein-binding lipoprotein Lpp
MRHAITNLKPIRRFTASNAGTVSREEFDELAAKVDSLVAEVDEVFSSDNLRNLLAEAVQPLLDDIDAISGEKVTNARTPAKRGAYLLPDDAECDDVSVAGLRNSVREPAGTAGRGYKLPEGD